MGLATYRSKRHFERSPEPQGKRSSAHAALRFVVQKHAASRLHYDFRLELDGVLKSWAVPKGPSLDPQNKRLAVMVEDHPIDYRTFEGTIPEGNYGAGTVMVWDEGHYHALQTTDRSESEKLLREGLAKGHASFILDGHKLKGEFSLIKLKRGKGNNWLLVKKKDEWSTDVDILEKDQSVASGRSLDEIAAGKKGKTRRKTSTKHSASAPKPEVVSKNQSGRQVKPMLATLVEKPFDREGWLFEVKWDGFRAIAEIGPNKEVSLYSRNHKPLEHRFQPIVDSLRKVKHEAVLDGEVVVVDEKGRSQFQLLQNYQKTGKGQLHYYVFDLLYLDGRDLRSLALTHRKEILGKILKGLPNVHISEHVEDNGIAFFEAAKAQGLEGIMAKNGNSPYREGIRSLDWLKIKVHQRQEAVIGGFTEPKGSRKNLGALVLGVYEGKELIYIGHTGGGLNTQGLTDLREKLDSLVQKACPFQKKPKTNAPAHWVKPQLVCEVSFQEWTDDGRMRMPIFVGLREDKPAHMVRREKPETAPANVGNEEKAKPRKSSAKKRSPGKISKKSARQEDNTAEPDLTNLNKVFWPQEGYTKGDVIAYYRDIAPIILPYLRDRPQSLNRHPNGIAGKSFFQKDVSRQPPPSWVKTITVPSESDSAVTYLLCQDEASLLYIVNLGCIELNPWNSRIDSLENPDYLIIDLDPQDVSFNRVVEVTLAIRKMLEECGAESVCKTSGKRGLHVFVPLGARYSYDQAKQFAEIIANLVNHKFPDSTSVARSPSRRQKRIYLDFLQNRQGQTLASPYSVRPYPGATVSTPLKWSEVRKGLDPTALTIKTTRKRLDKVGDLWKPVLGKGIDLNACLERLTSQQINPH